MKWSISELHRYQNEPLHIESTFDLNASLTKLFPDIIFGVAPVKVDGYVTYDDGDVTVSANVKTTLTVPSSRSLTPVQLPLDFNFTETYIDDRSHFSRYEDDEVVFLLKDRELIDFDTATKVTGPKFYYLKNEGALLELALTRYAIDILTAKGFTPVITPDLAKEEILEGIGFNPRGNESNIYTLEETGTCLVGTAEITLGGSLADTVLEEEKLPLMMAGLSHCFRREAGAAGQYSKGLYRVHQFTKVEMFIFCKPEESDRFHRMLLETEKEIFSGLDIPFRVVDTCTGDLGAPAYRKFDLEAWMPGRGDNGDFGEITSTSNCTDYQSRRLNIKYKTADGKKEYVHMLNGTAIAMSRAIIAIMENFQQADGSILIPEKLRPYTGFDRIVPKCRK